MLLSPFLGVLLILVVCPILGGLPLIRWIVWGMTGQRLDRLGTGNVSVSAAFYHGGKSAGILAVGSEALKGILAVLLARICFPNSPAWEVVALIALVIGRYGIGRGAGTTNVTWGWVVHDPIAAGLIFLLSGISFTLFREKKTGRLSALVWLVIIAILRHSQDRGRIAATVLLALIIAWIYQQMPDDLDLSADTAHSEAQPMFRFFRGNRALLSLSQSLDAQQVGQKAATLAQLHRWGYPIPIGWVLPAGDDSAPLINSIEPSPEQPVIVRSSAIGEDTATASAAGQYESIANVTSRAALEQAILRCQASYSLPGAVQYRSDREIAESGMAIIVQQQIRGVFSGVAFSRDPVARQGDAIVIEALPGGADQIVSGQVTPEQYRVWLGDGESPIGKSPQSWQLPEEVKLNMTGEGDVPPRLIQQVAYLARHLEARFHGIPQDIEWTFDGQQLWLLQARPITTLIPLWTRKIAAEVIPGFIRPLTWSINQPLTCGVWGEIFTIVLGNRAKGLDFTETATLHNSAAYFNASLLGEIFLRMGLPPESLEFLTRGAKFSKPPIASTLQNLPGLGRLAKREFQLEQDFQRDWQQQFQPGLTALDQQSVNELSPEALLDRIDRILNLLRRATYYSIFAPLSAALRQAIFKVDPAALDNRLTPETASLRSLQSLADRTRPLLTTLPTDSETLFAHLSTLPEGQPILAEFERLLNEYGYLSEVGTDIAVPTWREDPHPVRELLAALVQQPFANFSTQPSKPATGKLRKVQPRIDLKGRVTEVYSKLLAELRWSFVALEQQWLPQKWLEQPGDIFFLTFEEIRRSIQDAPFTAQLPRQIADRKAQLERDRQLTPPLLVYGNDQPLPQFQPTWGDRTTAQTLQGIGASAGRAEGTVLVLQDWRNLPPIDRSTILVVPYTDSGWAPLLARAGGLIAETGGQLSHGAIVAREYGIPAVMNVSHATQRFQNGQQVRVDGQQGTVEILD
ncbi:glycerol-3-phosphate acyltransferase [Leptolyngbya sp. FACHB-711]|uniref:glycerol-3-phosphate acyltransferase n=1 Tax=Leptolyngbya sp. FACHB-711 TaxID=2692813 RepID=UPI001689D9A8|nr:glycerol-3-phosphate acyltransferase [Leptolyngbya sp. FACHB-711]MBD2024945.1 glycerol-3-phosphate acyltransferase [Leptolyngbya sp. FACHB-711]